jgi:acid phosphatase (class A)
MQDEPLVTNSAKRHYARTRPFVYFHTHTCAPKWEHYLIHNGSYPSGHTTVGWATALVLAEINPARETQILKRGFEYGQSRVICGAHWQSDVDEGRVTGSILCASLHATPRFGKWVAEALVETID